ncbi:MAG TPA: sodium-dependent transporter [Candidatus Ventrisoma faecale]|nr:sodium-dependent transporter [Candidatus Ventrisoma faecale]
MNHKNGSFSNSLGFVLACVGSAVGLGNIWMFPYRLGQYGGGAFFLIYLLFILLFGTVGLSAEFAIGRRARTGTLGSYEYCWGSRNLKGFGKVMGWIPLLGSLGIAIGYSIIIGWVVRSLAGSVTGSMFSQGAAAYFAQANGEFGSLPWHIIVVLVTVIVLITGSTAQIERANKVMMPVFYVLFAALAVRVVFLPGASEGYKFLFIPSWEQLLDVDTWVMAMGQAFFSLSITGSGMLVYGSYLKKDEDIMGSSLQTAFFDTIAALLAALAIMPAVFAFGIEPDKGPSLIFLTLPEIFGQMPMGALFSAIFFLSVTFAGITSLINMFEAVIESVQHRFEMPRRAAVVLCGTLCLAVGVFLEAEPKVGSWMDFVTILVTPFGAVFGAISVYYVLGFKEIKKELEEGRKSPLPAWYGPVAKYVYVPLTVVVFILGIIYKGIG